MSLTVACVLVKGHVPFTAEYVVRLKSMCARSLGEHRFVCLTDRELPGIETIRIQAPDGIYAWWSKLELFNPAHGFTGRMLYLDLDVLVVGDLRPAADYPASFALVPDGAPGFMPRDGRKCVHRFNSSVMTWNAGERNHLYTEWTPKVARRLWGDQDWIGEQAPSGSAMPIEWFPRLSEAKRPPWPEAAKVILCKKPKNAAASCRWKWFDEAWR